MEGGKRAWEDDQENHGKLAPVFLQSSHTWIIGLKRTFLNPGTQENHLSDMDSWVLLPVWLHWCGPKPKHWCFWNVPGCQLLLSDIVSLSPLRWPLGNWDLSQLSPRVKQKHSQRGIHTQWLQSPDAKQCASFPVADQMCHNWYKSYVELYTVTCPLPGRGCTCS